MARGVGPLLFNSRDRDGAPQVFCAALGSAAHEGIARKSIALGPAALGPAAFGAARWPRYVVGAILFAALATATSSTFAQSDPYHITASEKAACLYDAQRFCMNTYPDEGALLACMKANRASLSTVCLAAFDAGMKKRHIK